MGLLWLLLVVALILAIARPTTASSVPSMNVTSVSAVAGSNLRRNDASTFGSSSSAMKRPMRRAP